MRGLLKPQNQAVTELGVVGSQPQTLKQDTYACTTVKDSLFAQTHEHPGFREIPVLWLSGNNWFLSCMTGASSLLSFHLLHDHVRHKARVKGHSPGCRWVLLGMPRGPGKEWQGTGWSLSSNQPASLGYCKRRLIGSLETLAEVADLGACPANTLGTISPPP